MNRHSSIAHNIIPPICRVGMIALAVAIASCFAVAIGILFGLAVIATSAKGHEWIM